jgi:flavin-dependent dehydrogenase
MLNNEAEVLLLRLLELDAVVDATMNDATACDIAVIGAGPAGSCAAIAAARAGARVVLVDRSTMPRAKVCGCCLAPRGISTLQSCGLQHIVRDALPLHHVLLESGARSMRVARAGSVSIARETLDTGLLEAAQGAGALLAMQTVASVDRSGGVHLRQRGITRTMQARMVIAADGLQGQSLADLPAFAWKVRRSSLMGMGAILPATAACVQPGEIRMRVHADGYVGLVRLPDGRIDVAAALRPEALRADHGPAACMRRMLGDAVLDAEAVLAAPWCGTPLLTRKRTRLTCAGVLVAGDAGGYVEPFTGEGMSWALASGAAAGVHAAAVLRGEATEDDWNHAGHALLRAARWRCRVTGWLLRHPAFVNLGLRTMRSMPSLSERIANAFGAAEPMPQAHP